MNLFTLCAYAHGATPTIIKGIRDMQLSSGLSQILSAGSGAVDPSFVSVGQIEPRVTFTSSDIKTILGKTGIDGVAMAGDKMYLSKLLQDGARAGATSHFSATMATGILIPVSIQASQGQEATISVMAVPRSADGTASPLAIVVNANLPSGWNTIEEVWTMGAVTINNTELVGIDNWTLDFGLELDITYPTGLIYPTDLSVIRRQPSITVSTADISKFQTWQEDGIAQDTNDSTVVLQDQTRGGVRGSSPITFAIDQGMIHFESVGGSHGAKAMGQVRITPTYDGVNDVLVITGLT